VAAGPHRRALGDGDGEDVHVAAQNHEGLAAVEQEGAIAPALHDVSAEDPIGARLGASLGRARLLAAQVPGDHAASAAMRAR
jgi:hypothetical protein